MIRVRLNFLCQGNFGIFVADKKSRLRHEVGI